MTHNKTNGIFTTYMYNIEKHVPLSHIHIFNLMYEYINLYNVMYVIKIIYA